jgi:hypothetical protein
MNSFTTKVNVSDEQINDVLESAFGAIYYWCDMINVTGADSEMKFSSEALTHGGKVTMLVDGENYELTKAKMLNGFKLYNRLNIDSFDSEDCDLVIQFALFGKQVYA